MTDLSEAEKLLAAAPDRFVAERKALARKLRDEGRAEDAAAVERMRKPTAVVSAVNRGARDRPKAARAAADAALRVREAQVGNDPEAFRQALGELDDALDLVANVAVAHVAPRGKAASETMRRRVRDLLRSAVADDEAREALARGALTEELDAPGFSPFAGMAVSSTPRKRGGGAAGPTRAERREAEKRAQAQALREDLERAEKELEAATKAAGDAERARARAEEEVESLRTKLARLG